MKLSINKTILWFAVALTGVLLTGCYKEDTSRCQSLFEVSFRFIYKDGADRFTSDVESVSLFAFDEQGVLAGRWDEFDRSKFVPGYTMSVTLPEGIYTFVAWGGLNHPDYNLFNNNSVSPFIIGQTTLEDCTLKLKTEQRTLFGEQRNALDLRPGDLFHGKTRMSGKNRVNGVTKVGIDLMKDTKTIKLTLIGLSPGSAATPYGHLNIYLESPNGTYDFLNNLVNPAQITYLPQAMTASVPTLKFNLYTQRMLYGKQCRLVIYNTEDGTTVFNSDLLETFISKIPRYYTQEGLDKEDLFEITIENNIAVRVTINGWTLDSSGNHIQ